MADEGFYTKLENKLDDFILNMHIYLMHGPKYEKYGLTTMIRNKEYEIKCGIVACEKKYHNKTTLTNLDIAHAQLRSLIALYYKLGYLDYHREERTHPKEDGYDSNRGLP